MEPNDEIEKELKLYFEKMFNIEFRMRLGGNKKIHMMENSVSLQNDAR